MIALGLIISGLITLIAGGDFFKQGTHKLTPKGWVVSLLIVFGIIVGIFDKNASNKEAEKLGDENKKLQLKADSLQSNLNVFQKHFDLKTQITHTQNELLQLTADSLKMRLESVSASNEVDKKKRELESLRLKSKLEQLEKQLNLAHKTIKENVESNRPQIDICQPIKWGPISPNDSTMYQIYVPICNTGKRTAQNFGYEMFVIEIDNKSNVVDTIPVENDYSEVSALPPYSETNYQFYRKLIQLKYENLKSSENRIILYFEFSFSDHATGEKLTSERCYSWNGFKQNNLGFNSSSPADLNLAKTYYLKSK